MTTKKSVFKRIGALIIAFAIIVTTYLSIVPKMSAEAETKTYEEGWLSQLEGFATRDEIITQACKLLGREYLLAAKGGDPWHDADGNDVKDYGSGQPKAIWPADEIWAIDCSGLIYWTLANLGYKTTGFLHNYPVPANTIDWVTFKDNITISCNGHTAKGTASEVFQKSQVNTNNKAYWLTEDGNTIAPGSVVIAMSNIDGDYDHSWIYMGEFESRAAVIDYLVKTCGVAKTTAETYVGDGKGAAGTHWRIESSGTHGVVINNNVDAKGTAGFNVSTIGITQDKGSLEVTKLYDPAGTKPEGTANANNFADYDKITFTLKNSEGKFVVATGSNGVYKATSTNATGTTFNLSTTGKLLIRELDPGTYTLTETTDFEALNLKVPANPSRTVEIKANSTESGTTTVEIPNHEDFGNLKVVKKSVNVLGVEDAVLANEVRVNARFTVYDDDAKRFVASTGTNVAGVYTYSAYTTSPVQYQLGADGTFTINELPEGHSYTVTEVATGANFEITSARAVATIQSDATTTVTFKNQRKSADLEVFKLGVDPDGNIYDATLDTPHANQIELNKAVKFKLQTYTGSYVTATGLNGDYAYLGGTSNIEDATEFTLNERGKFTITNLPTSPNEDSKYTLIEVETADGYILAEDFEFILSSNTGIPVENYEEGETLTINKDFILAELGEDEASDAMYEKCTFVIRDSEGGYLLLTHNDAETGSYSYSKKVANKDDATVLSLGSISHKSVIEGLPMGTYTVEEITDTEIFTPTETTQEVELSGNGGEVTFENTELYGGFNIYKETASMHNVSGIQFRIYGTSYGGRYIDVRSSETNASGFVAVDGIPYGEYNIEECGDTVLDCFSIADGQTIIIDKPMTDATPELTFLNELYFGTIKIHKENEADKPLQGFEFTIYAAEDIYEGEKIEENLMYKKGEEIEVLVTDVNGDAESTLILPYNYMYRIEETKAIKPYNCDSEPVTFRLERGTDGNSYYNLMVVEEEVEIKSEPLTEHELIITEDITIEGVEYKKGDTFLEFTTDEEGIAKVVLPALENVKFELHMVTPPTESDDSLASPIIAIEAPKPALSNAPITMINFVNTQQKCELTIYKVDEENEEVKLSGAEFDIIAMEDIYVYGELEYKVGDTITHVVTDENGEAKVSLWAGYMVGLKETKAPTGYNLSEDITNVDLSYDVKLLYTEQSVSVTNGYQMGKLTIYKIDANDTRKTLEGAEFDVIAKTDINVSGAEVKAGDVIAHVVTDKDGKASVELWSGYVYTLKETKAPTGYEMSDEVKEISIDYNPDILYSETSVSITNKATPDVPETGNVLPIIPVVGAGILILGAVVGVIVLKKKEN